MAKRKAARRARSAKPARKGKAARRSAKRPIAKRTVKRRATARRKAPGKKAGKTIRPKVKVQAVAKAPAKVPRLDRARRKLDERDFVQTPPSSLDMDRHGSAARSGRAGMEQSQRDHRGMSPDITAGDVDVDVEDAYFTGDAAPGGDNPTPDQDIVDDIGKALGVEYDDNEPLKASDKVAERDKHRWELDPASAEDYTDRDSE